MFVKAVELITALSSDRLIELTDAMESYFGESFIFEPIDGFNHKYVILIDSAKPLPVNGTMGMAGFVAGWLAAECPYENLVYAA